MTPTPLLEQMKHRVSAVKGRWSTLCAHADVDYVWLAKVMQGRIRDPGVMRVERVIRALDHMESAAGPDPTPPQDARREAR